MLKISGKLSSAIILTTFLFLFGVIYNAGADVIIYPETMPVWHGTSPSQPLAEDIARLVGFSGILNWLYKAEVDDPVIEDFPYAPYYTTVFNPPSDPSGAEIKWDGPQFITGNPLYLLVKDGNHEPTWYVFDLLNLNYDSNHFKWNGIETIQLVGFWLNQGAISNVAILGVPVPEPSTIILLGAGLVGIWIMGRRRKK